MEVNKTFCDECTGEISKCECIENQMRFVLVECMDEGKEYQFCGAECLKEFTNKKEFENRFYRYRTIKNAKGLNGGEKNKWKGMKDWKE